jgi:hypothetical protein
MLVSVDIKQPFRIGNTEIFKVKQTVGFVFPDRLNEPSEIQLRYISQ